MTVSLRTVLLASTALGFLCVAPAQAADNSTAEAIKALQAQVNALQKQLTDMQAKEATRAAAEAAKPAAAPAAAQTADAGKKEILPGVSVKLGGYVAMEGVYRDKNQTTDMSSNINTGIPFNNSLNAHTDEFRGSARQTRLSLLAEGKADENTKLSAYFETDFMGSGTTSNSVQTNSYIPRLRHAYAQVDRDDWGFHFVGGQAFSLASLNKTGLLPRSEVGVATIDSSGPPGYVYTRAPQVRFVKDFAQKKGQVGLSFEEAEVNFGGITPPATVTARNGGVSALNPDATYSSDFAPDVIAKVSYETSFGHYELFGMTRFFRDVVNSNGHNNYAMGYGGGVGAFIPVVPKKVDVQANFLVGKGVGRYASAQLPDFAFTPTGDIKPVTQMAAMVGIIGHVTPNLDIYTYFGGQRALRMNEGGGGTTYGYGNFSANNSGCYALNSGTCQAQTETVWQISPGFWNQIYKGDYGNIKVGAQYSFTRRDAFSGQDNLDPHAYENIVMMSFRYSPF